MIIPDDDHMLLITWIVTVAMQLLFFFIAYMFNFDKVTDFAGSTNFILIALLTLCYSNFYYYRQILITALILISKGYLGVFLLKRVLVRGKDARFDTIRNNFFAFLTFWIFQMVWAWVVSLPVIFVNADEVNPPLQASDWIGLSIFVLGFVCEVVADIQKDIFRSNKSNGSSAFICTGIWRYSRHPNFFGEIIMWWGIFIIGVPVYNQSNSSTWGYVTILSPIMTMFILLFLTGMPTCEGDAQKRYLVTEESKVSYLNYRHKTSVLIPMPVGVYEHIPLFIKRLLLFEFKMYEVDWKPPNNDILLIA